MLEQALVALSAAGGTALVQAAGSDAWTGLRVAVARWFGGGNEQRERAELERLDQTAGELVAAEAGGAERVRIRQEAAWQARFEGVLEHLDDVERIRAAEGLRALLTQHTQPGGASVGQGGLVVGGNVDVRAEGGSAAAVQMGDVTIGALVDPRQPGADQG
ncbi:hypothetical protein OG937_06560 [Streptomyces sp. NBC_00510]